MTNGLAASPAHAFAYGLRYAGDEVQLTNAIAAVAATDTRFAAQFVEALLAQAAEDCKATVAAQRGLAPVPSRLVGDRERRLVGSEGESLGFVDLIFEEAKDVSDFTLLVENKLYSGFGNEQLPRYHEGLREVRKRGGRGGLIAVTRDVPAHGELEPTDQEWLGSVRWARLLPRLRALDVQDEGVAAQWQALLDVLDDQGDLGMTTIDADAVRGWARYSEGRAALRWLLEQVHNETLAHLQRELRRIHRVGRPASELAGRGPKTSLVQEQMYEVRLGLSVPADYAGETVHVSIWMEAGRPYCGVGVTPLDGKDLLDQARPQLRRQVDALTDAGFEPDGKQPAWYSRHDASGVLDADDAPATLLALIRPDISAVVKSGILRHDVTGKLRRSERRKKQAKRVPAKPRAAGRNSA